MAVYERDSEGVLLDIVNDSASSLRPAYASITAPSVIRCVVMVDDDVVDSVYVGNGGSHSWWGVSSGPLIQGLATGQRLRVLVDGKAAMRIDWQ